MNYPPEQSSRVLNPSRNKECIEKWLVNRDFDGALGHVHIDEEGDPHYPFIMKQVESGEFRVSAQEVTSE